MAVCSYISRNGFIALEGSTLAIEWRAHNDFYNLVNPIISNISRISPAIAESPYVNKARSWVSSATSVDFNSEGDARFQKLFDLIERFDFLGWYR